MAIPTVSVCIPTYRGAEYLGPTIASVLGQSYRDFELIVVDDNSPDHTEQVVRSFNDPRVLYHRNERNLGPQGNWNHCVSLARGRYVKLMPHDDLLAASCLQRQVTVLDTDPLEDLALVFCARDVIGPSGRHLTRRGYKGERDMRVSATRLIRDCVRRGTNLVGEPGAVMFRRSLMQRVGAFDATYPYVIDLDYWVRLLAHGDAFYLAEPLSAFRVSPTQWSVLIGGRQSREFSDFVRHHCASHVDWKDLITGRFMSSLSNLLRLAFYRLYLR